MIDKIIELYNKNLKLNSYLFLITSLFLLKTHNYILNQNHLYNNTKYILKFMRDNYSFLEKDFLNIENIDQSYLEHLYEKINININNIEKDIFGSIYQKLQTVDLKKKTGQFFTSPIIAEKINTEYNIHSNTKIIDISCGSGIFYLSLIKRSFNQFNIEEFYNFIENNIYGIDIDPISTWICKINILSYSILLSNKFHKYNDLNIFTKDSLEYITENKFDIVIGNPPYVDTKRLTRETKQRYMKLMPNSCYGSYDLFMLFIEKGLSLLKNNGYLLFLIPNKFCISHYAKKLRYKILTEYEIEKIINYENQYIFDNLDVLTITVKIKNSKPFKEIINIEQNNKTYIIQKDIYFKNINNVFTMPPTNTIEKMIFDKFLSFNNKIGDYIQFKNNIRFNKGTNEIFITNNIKKNNLYKFLGGKNFGRLELTHYKILWDGFYFIYNKLLMNKHNMYVPEIKNFINPKIIIAQNSKNIMAVLDEHSFLCKNSYIIGLTKNKHYDDLKYFTVLLNSKLFSLIYQLFYKHSGIRGGYFRYYPMYIESLPIKVPTNEHKDKITKYYQDFINTNNVDILNSIETEINSFYNLSNQEISHLNQKIKRYT